MIATGKSRASGQRFNIAVAFESSGTEGRAIAESTFHHFADYNWDPRRGSPDFVSEAPAYTLPDTRARDGFRAPLRAQRGVVAGGRHSLNGELSSISTVDGLV